MRGQNRGPACEVGNTEQPWKMRIRITPSPTGQPGSVSGLELELALGLKPFVHNMSRVRKQGVRAGGRGREGGLARSWASLGIIVGIVW